MAVNFSRLADDHIDCREDGHLKSKRTVVESPIPNTTALRTECLRCGYQLTKIVARSGEIVGYRRRYPDGYLLRGEGRMDPYKRRKEVIRRMVNRPR